MKHREDEEYWAGQARKAEQTLREAEAQISYLQSQRPQLCLECTDRAFALEKAIAREEEERAEKERAIERLEDVVPRLGLTRLALERLQKKARDALYGLQHPIRPLPEHELCPYCNLSRELEASEMSEPRDETVTPPPGTRGLTVNNITNVNPADIPPPMGPADKTSVGLFSKYRVERLDGKPVNWCFVLQDTDPITPIVLLAYADAAERRGYKPLARDLRAKAGELEINNG